MIRLTDEENPYTTMYREMASEYEKQAERYFHRNEKIAFDEGAKAQLKKLIRWLKRHSEYIDYWDCYNDVRIGRFRGIKLEDWEALLKEIE